MVVSFFVVVLVCEDAFAFEDLGLGGFKCLQVDLRAERSAAGDRVPFPATLVFLSRKFCVPAIRTVAPAVAGCAGRDPLGDVESAGTGIGNNPQMTELRARIKALADSFGQPASGSGGGNTAELLQQQRDQIQRDIAAAQNGTGQYAGKGDAATGKDNSARPEASDMWAKVGAFVGGGASQQVSEQRRTNTLMQKSCDLLTSGVELWKAMNPSAGATWA